MSETIQKVTMDIANKYHENTKKEKSALTEKDFLAEMTLSETKQDPLTPIAGVGLYDYYLDSATSSRGKGGEYCGDNGYRGWSQIYLDSKKREEELRIQRANRGDEGNGGCGGGPKKGGESGAVTTSVATAIMLGLFLFVSRRTVLGMALSFMPNILEYNNPQKMFD